MSRLGPAASVHVEPGRPVWINPRRTTRCECYQIVGVNPKSWDFFIAFPQHTFYYGIFYSDFLKKNTCKNPQNKNLKKDSCLFLALRTRFFCVSVCATMIKRMLISVSVIIKSKEISCMNTSILLEGNFYCKRAGRGEFPQKVINDDVSPRELLKYPSKMCYISISFYCSVINVAFLCQKNT